MTLEFTLTNSSPDLDATGIGFNDDLDDVIDGLAVILPVPTEPCGAGSSIYLAAGNTYLALINGQVDFEQSCSFSVSLQVPAGAGNGSYQNRTSDVQATMDDTTIFVSPASDVLVVSDELLLFSKSFNQDSVAAGGSIDLTFNIDNVSATETVTDITFDRRPGCRPDWTGRNRPAAGRRVWHGIERGWSWHHHSDEWCTGFGRVLPVYGHAFCAG